MTKLIQEKVKQSLKAAESRYYRLVLLVGEPGSGKTNVLRDVANELGVPVININLELSAKLLELTAKQRTLHLPRLLDEIAETGNSTLIFDNLEILFDKDMKQDPLRLLERISRNHSIVASWNGKATGRKLTYAAPDHPEYRSYDQVDVLIVGMDSTATVDSAK
ncbi:ATPase AAA [Methanosarcina mazei]|uniref:ATPase AAA n=1 Tax=Methanosarcina mazei TaxID=2209 RepID=A0A0F8TVC4_METMZ|nr:BREX-3 system P-loop-containing protein BrxF [Methanosarcina mazei]KKF98491.1 ATPase AAA [Methanosarcina mazei]KKH39376.1 ATPase AAA [Methanosarcina mazei]KKH51291.1 ATPase AAA [Methanosarcina mazei]KKH53109.1 ATPase AAA [Methanosarcina mazei]KKH64078.1 ATPase AAA [Methanosarcina mazei]